MSCVVAVEGVQQTVPRQTAEHDHTDKARVNATIQMKTKKIEPKFIISIFIKIQFLQSVRPCLFIKE